MIFQLRVGSGWVVNLKVGFSHSAASALNSFLVKSRRCSSMVRVPPGFSTARQPHPSPSPMSSSVFQTMNMSLTASQMSLISSLLASLDPILRHTPLGCLCIALAIACQPSFALILARADCWKEHDHSSNAMNAAPADAIAD